MRGENEAENGHLDEAGHFQTLLEHGTGLLRQGQAVAAVDLLEEAYQMRPDNFDAGLNLSGAYILSKKFRRAVALLEALVTQEPKNPMAWTNLGAAYLGNPILSSEEMQRRAIETFEKALALDPDVPSVAYNIGLIYHRYLREPAAAQRWLERALRTNPNDRDAGLLLDELNEEE